MNLSSLSDSSSSIQQTFEQFKIPERPLWFQTNTQDEDEQPMPHFNKTPTVTQFEHEFPPLECSFTQDQQTQKSTDFVRKSKPFRSEDHECLKQGTQEIQEQYNYQSRPNVQYTKQEYQSPQQKYIILDTNKEKHNYKCKSPQAKYIILDFTKKDKPKLIVDKQQHSSTLQVQLSLKDLLC